MSVWWNTKYLFWNNVSLIKTWARCKTDNVIKWNLKDLVKLIHHKRKIKIHLERYVVTIKISRSIFNYTVQFFFSWFLHTSVLICVSCFKAFNKYQKCTWSFNKCQNHGEDFYKWRHNSDIYVPKYWFHLSFNPGQGNSWLDYKISWKR